MKILHYIGLIAETKKRRSTTLTKRRLNIPLIVVKHVNVFVLLFLYYDIDTF